MERHQSDRVKDQKLPTGSAPRDQAGLLSRLSELVLEADLLLAEGEVNEARARLTEALGHLPLGDRRRAVIRYRLGLVELEADNYETALDHLSEARRAYEKAGLDDRVRACRWGKVLAKLGLGEWESALSELITLRAEYERMGLDSFASWIANLADALEAELPEQQVIRITRARPPLEGKLGEEEILARLLDKLRRLEDVTQS